MKALISLLLLLLLSPVAFAQDDDDGAPPPKAMPRAVAPVSAKTTLRARVYYEDTGRSVRRTSVMLMPIEGGGRDLSGITDNEGNLEIKNVPTGRYYAFINAPGVVSPLAYADFRKPGREFLDEAPPGFPMIDVNGISDINVQIGARRGGAIGGRITYANGVPAIGVKVEILRKVEDEYLPVLPNLSALVGMYSGGGSFQTDDRGVYRMSGLPEGEYIVKVSESASHGKPDTRNGGYGGGFETMLFGGSSMLNVFYDNAFDQEKAQKINLQLGQDLGEINIIIPDRELHSIEGKLVAAKDKLPIRNAKLTIKRADDETTEERGVFPKIPQVAYTDGKGIWRFNELPKGTYKIVAEPENSDFDAKDQAYGDEPVDPSEMYNAAANRASNAANAVAYSSNIYGRDRIPEKPPEPKFTKAVKEFTVEEKDVTEQVIEMSFGATLSGTVALEKPNGLTGSIAITATNDKDITATTSLWLYELGGPGKAVKPQDFRLDGIASGKNSISITPSGQNSDYYVKSAASNQIDLLKGPFDFKDREVFANIRIVLASDVGILKGSVIDSGRQPVSGLTLTFVPTDPAKFATATYYRTAKTNAEGEFEIKLPPFEYAVVFIPARTKSQDDLAKWLTTAVKQAQTFKIEPGVTSKASIKFDRPK
ncbi:MAG TPA: carboxypeptidase-like regulatory domain-containing protein [Pyrinomonadaceae bacterium]|nr:carboxypeptidase-like regulatory domain-containing protein [Pyrinomonadaceae bacterium]